MYSREKQIFQVGDEVAGRYRIKRFVGAGGMGQVYEATDLELLATVALKTLKSDLSSGEEALRTFKREIQIARRITHPNVCRTFDFGRHASSASDEIVFLTMEFISGQTLDQYISSRRGLPPSEALDLTRQLADGLAAAHCLGIVHRDFKSGNVMLIEGPAGELSVKITDFGTARSVNVSTSDATVTATQHIVGTPAYMAPEQFLGHATTASDIYALGVVMYQMLTAILPSDLPSQSDRFAMLPTGTAGDDHRWRPVIQRCLDPDPSKRYSSVLDVAEALEPQRAKALFPRGASRRNWMLWAAAGGAGALVAAAVSSLWNRYAQFPAKAVGSLAVLPVSSTPHGGEADYLADGITESLISDLSRLRDLRLMSRSAVMRFKGSGKDPIEVGKLLHVDAALVGLLKQELADVELSLELVEISSGVRLWGRTYKRALSMLSHLPGDVTEDLVEKLRNGLRQDDAVRLSRRGTENYQAYRAYLKGRYEWNKRTLEGYQLAASSFMQAIDQDPAYALAYSGLADAYSFQSGSRKPQEVFPLAKAAALKAISIDDEVGEAHASLGFVFLQYEWNWAEAEREYARSIELDANYAPAHSMYSRLLSVMGRFDEAFDQIKIAQTLDPLSIGIANNVGFLYYLDRQYEKAATQFRHALDLQPTFENSTSYLAYVKVAGGHWDDAIALYRRLLAAHPDKADMVADTARAYAAAGNLAQAERLLGKLKVIASREYVLPTLFAQIYAALGAKSIAIQHLETARLEKAWQLIYLKVEPIWDPLRGDPDFQALLRSLNFV